MKLEILSMQFVKTRMRITRRKLGGRSQRWKGVKDGTGNEHI